MGFKQYANSFQAKSRLGLETVRALCQKCDNPQDGLKFIHIAGTNGKGSVCAFLESILIDSGLKTGKFISPNMIDVTERISVDGKNITNEELNEILDIVEKAANDVCCEKGVMPTQFEIWTAAAFIYFKKIKCDIVVLETGLGGRLDATNIINTPLVSVITKIGIDHTDYLGNTIEKITLEKAGIIKERGTVITAIQEKEAEEILKKTANDKKSEFIICDECKNGSHDGLSEIFDVGDYKNLRINLAGTHQTENAALAVKVADYLKIDASYIRSGLLKARNMGRFELVSKNPYIIFDGAHNESGTSALTDSLERYFPDKKLSIIYGCMADKDLESSLRIFKQKGYLEKVKFFTVTVKDNPRAEKSEILSKKLSEAGFCAESCHDIKDALKKASQIADVLVICGSLYLYKDLKNGGL